MPLWTDLITPVEATGIARAELELIEQAKGNLARWLPNILVASDHVKFMLGDHGLVDEAFYRAFNAAPEVIGGEPVKSTMIELPAMSTNQPLDERTQKDMKRLSDDQLRKGVVASIKRAVQATADLNEKTRGRVIHSGRATATQHNFILADDFGRDTALSYTLGKLWSDASADGIGDIGAAIELYASKNNGAEPGCILMSRAAMAAFSKLAQFRTVLVGGATRPPMANEVAGIAEAAGYPPIEMYNRSTKSGLVLPREYIYFLPEPTDTSNPDGTALGATFWGETVTAAAPEFDIPDSEQPGLVVGVYREDRIPYKVEIMSDALTLPVARDANKAMAVKVL